MKFRITYLDAWGDEQTAICVGANRRAVLDRLFSEIMPDDVVSVERVERAWG